MLHVCVCVTGRTSMSSTSSNQTVIGCHANPMLFLRMLATSTWCPASHVGGGAGVRQEEWGDREYFDGEKWQIVPVQDEAQDAAGTRIDSNCQSSDPALDFLMLARPWLTRKLWCQHSDCWYLPSSVRTGLVLRRQGETSLTMSEFSWEYFVPPVATCTQLGRRQK